MKSWTMKWSITRWIVQISDNKMQWSQITHGAPYRGVHIRTVGHLLEDEVRVLEMTQRMAHEHLGEEKAKAYTEARVGAQGLILRIEPGEMRSWDFSDTPGLGET